jgi:prepilin-type N-terminal cleavage/methylation domain-containing protein/prepilin-type processing-associated H-X9-DG protein
MNGTRRNGGFTLIELLVVIAIISVLAAIIMPVYSRAKFAGRQSVCASNLRQFADAFKMYANDWRGVWPAPGGELGERNYWDPALETYIKCPRSNDRRDSVWVCPQHTEPWKVPYEIRSYSMNMYLRTPCDVDPWQRNIYIRRGIDTCDIDYLSDTILLCEGKPDLATGYVNRPANWETVAGYPATRTRPRHFEGNNYLFCDGHIKAMRWEQTVKPLNLWYVRQAKREG